MLLDLTFVNVFQENIGNSFITVTVKNSEAAARKCFNKKHFRKISPNSPDNTCAAYFLK